MPIELAVRELIAGRRLVLRPSSFLQESARCLYVTPEIDNLAREPFADTDDGDRLGELAAFLDAFSEMNMITVSEDPRGKPRDVMLARVEPVADDFWSMRVTTPERFPGIRVLGGFCAKDEFVALICKFREDMLDFDDEVAETKECWKEYFGAIRPYSGSGLDDYITNYYVQ